jgi:hypothetical protein
LPTKFSKFTRVDANLIASPFMPNAPWTALYDRIKKDLGASLSTAAAAAIKLETGLYPRHASRLTAP